MESACGRIVAAVLTLLWVGMPGVAVAEDAAPVFDVPKLEGIAVDGRPDDWGAKGLSACLLAPVNGWSQPARLRPAHDHDVQIRLGWNDDGFLMRVHSCGSAPAEASRRGSTARSCCPWTPEQTSRSWTSTSNQ